MPGYLPWNEPDLVQPPINWTRMKEIPFRSLSTAPTSLRLSDAFDIRSIEQVLGGKDVVQALHRHDHYFLLVVTRGGRSEGVVDAYVWDLERDQLLMSLRTRANGRLIPVRIGEGRGPWPSELDLSRSGAQDCSIAGALRELAGEPVGIPSEPTVGVEDARPATPN